MRKGGTCLQLLMIYAADWVLQMIAWCEEKLRERAPKGGGTPPAAHKTVLPIAFRCCCPPHQGLNRKRQDGQTTVEAGWGMRALAGKGTAALSVASSALLASGRSGLQKAAAWPSGVASLLAASPRVEGAYASLTTRHPTTIGMFASAQVHGAEGTAVRGSRRRRAAAAVAAAAAATSTAAASTAVVAAALTSSAAAATKASAGSVFRMMRGGSGGGGGGLRCWAELEPRLTVAVMELDAEEDERRAEAIGIIAGAAGFGDAATPPGAPSVRERLIQAGVLPPLLRLLRGDRHSTAAAHVMVQLAASPDPFDPAKSKLIEDGALDALVAVAAEPVAAEMEDAIHRRLYALSALLNLMLSSEARKDALAMQPALLAGVCAALGPPAITHRKAAVRGAMRRQ